MKEMETGKMRGNETLDLEKREQWSKEKARSNRCSVERERGLCFPILEKMRG